ncbi:MAG: TrkA family potassium uptake protein [Elusimicrobia bacterium]|nr:TrkA family potassium uptake protein [Elusimicrobiota bacterium]
MNIIVVGGGNVGRNLAEKISVHNYVTLIEKDPDTSERLACQMNILVIQGDGCDIELLKQAGIAKADVVAAVTGSDVDNLVICQIAKDIFHVKRSVAKVNDPKNEKIFYQLGVDVAIGSTAIIAKVIEDEVSWEDFITLFTFKRGNLSIIRVDLPESSPVINSSINEITLPEDSVLVAIIRNGEIMIPKANSVLKEKDEVIAITKVENESQLFKSLIGEVDEK